MSRAWAEASDDILYMSWVLSISKALEKGLTCGYFLKGSPDKTYYEWLFISTGNVRVDQNSNKLGMQIYADDLSLLEKYCRRYIAVSASNQDLLIKSHF